MLTSLPRQVWLQAIGRWLYQMGSAVVLFYTPIVFVNYGGLSATAVGLAIGGGSLAGFLGNLVGGGMADSPLWGRRGTLLMAGGLSIVTVAATVAAHGFAVLLLANILFGISVGLYWTAADAAVMDATTLEQRQSAFSVLTVMDNLGFGMGTLGGGLLLPHLAAANWVFGISGVAFTVFLGLVAIAIEESRHPEPTATDSTATDATANAAAHAEATGHNALEGWKTAIADGRLMAYLLVNTQFVTFLALVSSTLPLYFVKFGLTAEPMVSNLFTWGYVGLGVLAQLPMLRVIARFSYLRSLMLSLVVWCCGFLLIWALTATIGQAWLQFSVFGVFAIATVIYKPTSAAWIAELAPASLRGVYTAIAYQCWSLGYIVGPIVGGWALDQAPPLRQTFWLVVGLSTVVGIGVLQLIEQKQVQVTNVS